MTSAQIIAAVLVGLFNALIGLAVYRMNRGMDKREARLDEIEGKVHGIELAMAGELPSKEDVNQLNARLDALAATLDKVKDMVTRLDEREKVRHERA